MPKLKIATDKNTHIHTKLNVYSQSELILDSIQVMYIVVQGKRERKKEIPEPLIISIFADNNFSVEYWCGHTINVKLYSSVPCFH